MDPYKDASVCLCENCKVNEHVTEILKLLLQISKWLHENFKCLGDNSFLTLHDYLFYHAVFGSRW